MKMLSLVFPASLLYVVVATTMPVTGGTQASADDALSPIEIINRMARVYDSCKSYHDSGVVKTQFIEPDRSWTSEQPFSTAFIRPDQFRFEFKGKAAPWTDDWFRYVVWHGGGRTKTWWDLDSRLENPESLSMGIAGATGVSGGAAHTVPALLIPDQVSGFRLTQLGNLKRLADDKLDGLAGTIQLKVTNGLLQHASKHSSGCAAQPFGSPFQLHSSWFCGQIALGIQWVTQARSSVA